MDNKCGIYNIDLEIEAGNHFITSNTKLDYYCKEASTNTLKFYIYKDMQLEAITCNRKISYEVGKEVDNWSPFILESKLIKISFEESIYEGEYISIQFKYKGHINIAKLYGINRLTKEWIELGLYTPWFPLNEKLEQALFYVNIKINKEYKVINSRRLGDNSLISLSQPSVDCPIIACNCFKCMKNNVEGISIDVYYTKDSYKKYAQQISNYSIKILRIFSKFGDIDSRELSIVIAPREDGGGYCRAGLIVLTSDDDSEDEVGYFKFIAHELGHLWWCKAKKPDTWEDWLNESFAEFSALLAVREVFGEDQFNARIQAYTEKTKNLPHIIDLDRGNDKAYAVLYMKGPVILSELEKDIGRDKFIEFLNKVHMDNIDTTEKLLNKLCEITSQDMKQKLISLLNQ